MALLAELVGLLSQVYNRPPTEGVTKHHGLLE